MRSEGSLSPAPHVLCADLTQLTPQDFQNQTGITRGSIDVIVGGPPCQGFSQVRQRDGSNHAKSNPDRFIEDPRRSLYIPYFEFVKHYQPKVFVMENVLGIKSAAAGHYYQKVKERAKELGYRVAPYTVRAADFGVPQKRVRQLVIGTRLDVPAVFTQLLLDRQMRRRETTLWEAIGDLPRLRAGEGMESIERDWKRLAKLQNTPNFNIWYLRNVAKPRKSDKLTAHRARPHSVRDLRDFAMVREGENGAQAIARGADMLNPYDKESFGDRYTRQHRNRLCSTIVAHLSKDGLMFIHPTQNRSLTPREAARVQSFPDSFHFSVPRTHQYKMIGNAVPPLVGRAVGRAVKQFLLEAESNAAIGTLRGGEPNPGLAVLLPKSYGDAQKRIEAALGWSPKNLRQVPKDTFLQAWAAIFWLCPGLHPDSVDDVGRIPEPVELSEVTLADLAAKGLDPELFGPDDAGSGWPIPLLPMLKEAWRRYEAESLTDDEMYPSDVVIAGWR